MAAMQPYPPDSSIRDFLDYNHESGIFIWKKSPNNGVSVGDLTGSPNAGGWLRIRFRRRSYYAHRLAWWWMTGEWPLSEIDHRDTDRANNKFKNLRPADRAGNLANSRLSKANTSGFKGVTFDKSRKLWNARIVVHGRTLYLGRFDDRNAAAHAYDCAAISHFGEFARLNLQKNVSV